MMESQARAVNMFTHMPIFATGRGFGFRVTQNILKISLLTSSSTQNRVNVEASGKAEAKRVM